MMIKIIKALVTIVVIVAILMGLGGGEKYGAHVVAAIFLFWGIVYPIIRRLFGKSFSDIHNNITNSK